MSNLSEEYTIVNRVVRFKEDTCQRIDEREGNILSTSKDVIGKISGPFIDLSNSMQNDVPRNKLQDEIEKIKAKNLAKKRELKKREDQSSGGYIAMGALIVVSTILVAGFIFVTIGNLLR